MSERAVITTPEVCRRMGISKSALWRWAGESVDLSGCILKSGKGGTWWSVQRLRDRGFLLRSEAEADTPVLSFEARLPIAGTP